MKQKQHKEKSRDQRQVRENSCDQVVFRSVLHLIGKVVSASFQT